MVSATAMPATAMPATAMKVTVMVVMLYVDRLNDHRRSAAIIEGQPRPETVARHIGVVRGIVWSHRLGTPFDAGRENDRCEELKSAHAGNMVRGHRSGKSDLGGKGHRNEK